MQKTIIQTFLLATATMLISACSDIPHDNDRLYLHGYVAIAGENTLEHTHKDMKDTQANESGSMQNAAIQLKNGDDIISQQAITLNQQWPQAYKLEFTPPQINEASDDLKLVFTLVNNADDQLLYQKKVTLNDPLLFSTQKDIVISPYSAETSENSEQQSENASQELALYESFQCENSNDLKAIIKDHYMIIAEPLIILPRTATLPEPIYSSADTLVSFHSNQQFHVKLAQQERVCELNEDSFSAWQNSQEKLKSITDKKDA